jgi:hypothetical protein
MYKEVAGEVIIDGRGYRPWAFLWNSLRSLIPDFNENLSLSNRRNQLILFVPFDRMAGGGGLPNDTDCDQKTIPKLTNNYVYINSKQGLILRHITRTVHSLYNDLMQY